MEQNLATKTIIVVRKKDKSDFDVIRHTGKKLIEHDHEYRVLDERINRIIAVYPKKTHTITLTKIYRIER